MVESEEVKSVNQGTRNFHEKEMELQMRDTGTGDDYAIIDIVHPQKKGILTWLRGYRYPFPGFPIKDTVMTIATVKRIIPAALKYCFQKPIMFIFGLLYLFSKKTFIKLIHKALEAFINFAYPSIKKHFLNPNRMKKPVREIYRVLSIGAEREMRDSLGLMKDKWEMGRDVLCMLLEYDNAYLLRLQDIANEINLEEIKLDAADWYYVKPRNDYDFGGRKKAKKEGNPISLGSPTKNFTKMDDAQLKRFESRRAAIQGEFDKLNQEREGLMKQARQFQTRLDEIGTILLRLQGRFAEVAEEEGHYKQIQDTEKRFEAKELESDKEQDIGTIPNLKT